MPGPSCDLALGTAMQVHSIGRKMPEEVSPAGDWLMALYYSMLNTTRWQRQGGADFVFYDPHPGFTDGSAEAPYYKLLCDDFQHAMHIAVERGQRNICQVPACCACFPTRCACTPLCCKRVHL